MFHTIIVVGHLGRDPEMRYTPAGKSVTNFSLAASRKYKASDGELVDETVWFRVSVWGAQAEACNTYLKKGRAVLVEGHLVADSATGGPRVFERQDGTYGAAFEISALTVRFLSGKDQDGQATGAGPVPAKDDSSVDDDW